MARGKKKKAKMRNSQIKKRSKKRGGRKSSIQRNNSINLTKALLKEFGEVDIRENFNQHTERVIEKLERGNDKFWRLIKEEKIGYEENHELFYDLFLCFYKSFVKSLGPVFDSKRMDKDDLIKVLNNDNDSEIKLEKSVGDIFFVTVQGENPIATLEEGLDRLKKVESIDRKNATLSLSQTMLLIEKPLKKAEVFLNNASLLYETFHDVKKDHSDVFLSKLREGCDLIYVFFSNFLRQYETKDFIQAMEDSLYQNEKAEQVQVVVNQLIVIRTFFIKLNTRLGGVLDSGHAEYVEGQKFLSIIPKIFHVFVRWLLLCTRKEDIQNKKNNKKIVEHTYNCLFQNNMLGEWGKLISKIEFDDQFFYFIRALKEEIFTREIKTSEAERVDFFVKLRDLLNFSENFLELPVDASEPKDPRTRQECYFIGLEIFFSVLTNEDKASMRLIGYKYCYLLDKFFSKIDFIWRDLFLSLVVQKIKCFKLENLFDSSLRKDFRLCFWVMRALSVPPFFRGRRLDDLFGLFSETKVLLSNYINGETEFNSKFEFLISIVTHVFLYWELLKQRDFQESKYRVEVSKFLDWSLCCLIVMSCAKNVLLKSSSRDTLCYFLESYPPISNFKGEINFHEMFVSIKDNYKAYVNCLDVEELFSIYKLELENKNLKKTLKSILPCSPVRGLFHDKDLNVFEKNLPEFFLNFYNGRGQAVVSCSIDLENSSSDFFKVQNLIPTNQMKNELYFYCPPTITSNIKHNLKKAIDKCKRAVMTHGIAKDVKSAGLNIISIENKNNFHVSVPVVDGHGEAICQVTELMRYKVKVPSEDYRLYCVTLWLSIRSSNGEMLPSNVCLIVPIHFEPHSHGKLNPLGKNRQTKVKVENNSKKGNKLLNQMVNAVNFPEARLNITEWSIVEQVNWNDGEKTIPKQGALLM